MAIAFTCDCGQQLQARDEHAGRQTRCPKCGNSVPIPGAEAAAPPPPPLRPEPVAPRPRPRPDITEDDDTEERRPRRRDRDRAPIGTSMAAIFSLILGILSPCLLVFAAIPAIVLGVVGLRAVRGSEGRLQGGGMAVAGIILGVLGLVCTGLTIPITIGLRNLGQQGMNKLQNAAARMESQNNLMQIGLAFHTYADANGGKLPPAVVYDVNGKPLYSWRVLLLPYLEQDGLFRQFHLDEPWDSPHNKQLMAQMPPVYAPPGRKTTPEPYGTFYQVFDGPKSPFNSDKSRGLQLLTLPFAGVGPTQLRQAGPPTRFPIDFTDGTSNTFLVAEAGEAVPWSKPADLAWDPNGPLPKLGGLFDGDFLVVMGDAAVRHIPKNTPAGTIRAAITMNGGETVNLPP
jgi:hypothetical protein